MITLNAAFRGAVCTVGANTAPDERDRQDLQILPALAKRRIRARMLVFCRALPDHAYQAATMPP